MIIKLAQFSTEVEMEKEAGLFGRMGKAKAIEYTKGAMAKLQSGGPGALSAGEAAALDLLNTGRKAGRHISAADEKLTGKINSGVGKAVDFLKEKSEKAGQHIKSHSGRYALGAGVAGAGAAGYLATRKK